MAYELLEKDSYGTSPKLIAPIVEAVTKGLREALPYTRIESVTGFTMGRVNEYGEKAVYYNEIVVRDNTLSIDFTVTFGNRKPDKTHPNVPLSELVQVDIKVSSLEDNGTYQFISNIKGKLPIGQSECGSTFLYIIGTFLIDDENLVEYLVKYIVELCKEQEEAREKSIADFKNSLRCKL